MRKYFFIILLSIISLPMWAETVTNVRAQQEGDRIVILYDLSKNIDVMDLRICIGKDERSIPYEFLSGDINRVVPAGKDKRIEYDFLSDYTEGLDTDNVSFVVLEGIYEYIDLGLSVKWATFNVGATKPEEYGHHFAWGETKPKTSYDWYTYKWCNGTGTSLTKYIISRSDGTLDSKNVLDKTDDAAAVNWGDNWRMPTYDEMSELLTLCFWTWTTLNDVNGFMVTSRKNGNSIFLPAAGCRYGKIHNFVGRCGNYWSSSLTDNTSSYALELTFQSTRESGRYTSRYYGNSVRPVYP
jgi:hypothetical protein